RSAGASFGAAAVAAPGGESDLWQDDRRIVAVWGRPRFTDADLSALAQHQGIAHALAEGYARKGADVLPLLSGRFALALLDAPAGEAVLATDRIGSAPLCHADSNGRLVFGSTLDAIGALPGVASEVEHQAIYDYVYFHMVPGPRTIYRGRNRLPPGTFLRWQGAKAEVSRYWEMRYVESERRPFPDLKQAFLARVHDAVRTAAADGPVGA